jgi:hypothetical protein
MKKLMMTTALVGLLSAPAFAQEGNGVELGIKGYAKMYGVYVDQDEAAGQEARTVDIIRDTEFHLTGEMALDNGLTVGADVGIALDAGDTSDITDSFIYFSGNWGRINFGQTDGAAYLLQVQAPSADANYDGMDQYYSPFNYTVAGSSTLAGLEFDYDQAVDNGADKLTYISPKFNGFQLGVSYTPENKPASRGLNGVAAADDERDFEDIIDVAARYDNEISWGSYSLGAGYSHGSIELDTTALAGSPRNDRAAWNVGADVNMGALGLGAVYTQDDLGDLGGADSAQKQYIFGADYKVAPHTVLGATYLNQKNEFGANEIKTQRYTGGVTYNYGPGVDFRGVVTHIDHDVDAALGADISGTSLMLGTSISF